MVRYHLSNLSRYHLKGVMENTIHQKKFQNVDYCPLLISLRKMWQRMF